MTSLTRGNGIKLNQWFAIGWTHKKNVLAFQPLATRFYYSKFFNRLFYWFMCRVKKTNKKTFYWSTLAILSLVDSFSIFFFQFASNVWVNQIVDISLYVSIFWLCLTVFLFITTILPSNKLQWKITIKLSLHYLLIYKNKILYGIFHVSGERVICILWDVGGWKRDVTETAGIFFHMSSCICERLRGYGFIVHIHTNYVN